MTDKQTARQIAREVAPLLGEGWVFDDRDSAGASIAGPDDAELFFYLGYGSKGKVTISSSYPNGTYQKVWKYDRFEIGVSVSRGAAVIAKEIQRRLLPDYLPELARVRQAIADHDAAEARRDSVAEVLGKIVGSEARGGEIRLYHSGGYHGAINVGHGGDNVRIELGGLSSEQAELILSALVAHD